MDYPTDLPLSAASVQIFEEGMSPQYDITWSFTYEVNAYTPGDELGYCMFLQNANVPLSGGGVGPDLGFSGDPDITAPASSRPMTGPILGIGFDSLGVFASDLTYTTGASAYRDGSSYVPNSITIRDKDFNLVVTKALTAFDIVSSGKRTIRARLGNYGRTIFVDFKNNTDTFFTPLLTHEITGLEISTDTRYRPGISFVKPLTSSNTNGVIITTGFHVEGNQNNTTESEFEFTPLSAFDVDNVVVGPVPLNGPVIEDRPPLPFLGMEPNIGCPDGSCDIAITGAVVDNGFYPNTILYQMSAFIGDVELQWNTPGNPYRFIFKYDNINRIDTGFVGGSEYNYNGNLRSTFINGISSSANHGSYPITELAPDGYPYVYDELSNSLSSFHKDTDSPRLEVEVYSPLSATDWEVSVGCPYYTLSCGTEDSWLCGLTQQHETLRKIVFTNYNPDA